nr:tyrosine-protein phosphatase [Aestuariicella hydrocarbonica]
MSACETSTPAVNNIEPLSVSYDEQNHTYQLQWQASAPQQPVAIAVATSAARWLPLEGGRNFRDLGGYSTQNGQQVRWGKLFCSGAMTALTEQNYQLLDTFDVATIVDFRSADERHSEPTEWSVDNARVLSWDYDMDMGAGGTFAEVFRQPELNAEKVEAAMALMYPDILLSQQPHYRAMFDRLIQNDGALVFNCTAGKDRTGIAAVLILTALGVDRETVINDFMLSDLYYQQHPTSFISPKAEDGDAKQQAMMAMFKRIPPEVLKPVKGGRESYIKAAIDSMEQQSGSVLAYIQQELDVDDQELQQLRKNFLQPAAE